MKTDPRIWAMGLCFAGLLAAAPAQATVTLTFDEYGNSSGYPGGGVLHAQNTDYAGGSGGSTIIALGADAGKTEPNGGGANTLTYLLPEMATKTWLEYGWVVVYAPGTSSPGLNDVNIVDLIHFDNSGAPTPANGTTYDQIFYYSKEGSGTLANNGRILTLLLIWKGCNGFLRRFEKTQNMDGVSLYESTQETFAESG